MSRLKLTKKQNEYIREANSRWCLKVGAVRSGKSFVDVAYVIPFRIRERIGKPGLTVIMGVSKGTIERNVLQPMREIYTSELVGTINNENMAQIFGETVYCLGAEKMSQVAKILGSSIKYCYGDEIAKWNKDVFEVLKSRLDKSYSVFDGACNPESPNHWLKEFIEKPDLDAYIQHYKIFDNPYLPADFVENICNEYEGTVFYGRYILGEWTLAEGLIYPMYEKAIEEPPEGEPEDYRLSIDYGTMNAFAALLWGKYGKVWYAIRGYYYSGRDTGVTKTDQEYAEDLKRLISDIMEERELSVKSGYVEYFRKMKTIIDPSAASMITLLRKEGWFTVVPADNSVMDGIRDTATAMQTGLIKISPSIKEWKSEAGGYVWDSASGEDRPLKDKDHYMDATRYMVRTEHLVVRSKRRDY